VQTVQYGGIGFNNGNLYGTSIIPADRPGNFSLHYYNPFPNNSVNGSITMGYSSVTFTTPYAYAGTISVLVGAIVVAVTVVLIMKKLRRPIKTQAPAK
jgi:hypothetical protein